MVFALSISCLTVNTVVGCLLEQSCEGNAIITLALILFVWYASQRTGTPGESDNPGNPKTLVSKHEISKIRGYGWSAVSRLGTCFSS